jgi:hypothetical protein
MSTIKVIEIPLREKPSHGAVKRVSRITEDWMFLKLGGIAGFRKFRELKNQENAPDFKGKLFEDQPELMMEFINFQERIGEYQTIMLATGWNLQKMIDFEVGSEEELSEEDYQALLRRCIITMGGTAADFFGVSNTGSSSPAKETTEEPEESSKV